MVRLRMKRMGRRHRPFYRICVMDQRSQRDGRSIEEIGHYNPLEKDFEKAVTLDTERVKYWLGVGAQPSETVRGLLQKLEVIAKDTPKAAPAPSA